MAKANRGGQNKLPPAPPTPPPQDDGYVPEYEKLPEDDSQSDGLTPKQRLAILKPDIDRFKDDYDIALNGIEKCNINEAHEIIEKAETIIKEYGLTGKDVPKIDISSKGIESHTMGQFEYYLNNPTPIGITLNTRYFLDKNTAYGRSRYANSVKNHYHPDGSLSDTITHELGHAVLYKYHQSKKGTFASDRDIVAQAVANVDKIDIPPKYGKNVRQIGSISPQESAQIKQFTAAMDAARGSISKYANTMGTYGIKHNETIAEAFADAYRNGSKANKYSKEIVRLIRKDTNG